MAPAPEPDDSELQNRLRSLPAVDRVIAALGTDEPHGLLAGAARLAVDRARQRVRAGAAPPSVDEVIADARGLLGEADAARLQRVLNATGVLIHTNLGRVPLGDEQMDAVREIATGYSNLEYDLLAGRRGSRYSHARRLLTALTGAESALVVNNNAAAVLLVLAALCTEREVIISRGELIEIGGEFRIPEVMSASGARLVEVGTTNRTHLGDYERAITDGTAAILKVHPSNYQVVGFTASVEGRDLARLARGRGVLLLNDLGSGYTGSPAPEWVHGEPVVADAISEGADIVTFSGDKLLGGPQAGIVAGRADLVTKLERHPLLRALRVDKMTLAALEATLDAHLNERGHALPLWRAALASPDELEERARSLSDGLRAELSGAGVKVEPVPTEAVTGGGSLPGRELRSWGVAIVHPERTAAELERALRTAEVPVIARVEDERVVLDLRTVPAADDEILQRVVLAALTRR